MNQFKVGDRIEIVKYDREDGIANDVDATGHHGRIIFAPMPPPMDPKLLWMCDPYYTVQLDESVTTDGEEYFDIGVLEQELRRERATLVPADSDAVFKSTVDMEVFGGGGITLAALGAGFDDDPNDPVEPDDNW